MRFAHRALRVWAYSASHNALLMMSPPDDAHSSRLMLLFKGTEQISCPTTVLCTGVGEDRLSEGLVRYAFEGAEDPYYVVARAMSWLEDDLDHNAPNLMDRFFGAEL